MSRDRDPVAYPLLGHLVVFNEVNQEFPHLLDTGLGWYHNLQSRILIKNLQLTAHSGPEVLSLVLKDYPDPYGSGLGIDSPVNNAKLTIRFVIRYYQASKS